MGQVARYDAVQIQKPERTSQGFLRAGAVLTRSGVFVYRNADGSTRREYRPADEVFHADALSSFEDAPITIDHPDRLVTADNARAHAVGLVKDAPRRDGQVAVSRVLVTDAKAIEEIESGRRRAVSCGYTCDYDPTPGTTPEGERYDGVQRNIRGNHLALVPVGRAGPEARVRLDAGDATLVGDAPAPSPQQQPETTMKIRLDGVDFECTEQLAQAITAAQEKQQKRADELEAQLKAQTTEAEKAKARADAAESEAKKAQQERADALKPEAVQDKVRSRLALERSAAKVLGEKDADGNEIKLDAMTNEQIRTAVIARVHPEAKLDGVSAEYLQARFDAALEAFEKKPNEGLAALRTAAGSPTLVRLDAARADAQKKRAEAWKQTL